MTTRRIRKALSPAATANDGLVDEENEILGVDEEVPPTEVR